MIEEDGNTDGSESLDSASTVILVQSQNSDSLTEIFSQSQHSDVPTEIVDEQIDPQINLARTIPIEGEITIQPVVPHFSHVINQTNSSGGAIQRSYAYDPRIFATIEDYNNFVAHMRGQGSNFNCDGSDH